MCARHSTVLILDTGILEAATGLEASREKRPQLLLQTVYTALHAEPILTVLFRKQSVASLQKRNC